jgi:uncharacterized membrane protein YgcG
MSGDSQSRTVTTGSFREQLRARGKRGARVLFGDRVGLVVFLGTVLWCVSFWRIGIFITDTLTVANTLANVANGHLAIEQTPYSLTIGSQPGVVRVGDQVFGRNYGHVFLALPLVWILEGVSLVTDPRLLLAGGWSLLLITFAGQIRRITGRARALTVGSGVALVIFLLYVALATPLSEKLLPLVALQLSTILATALLATTLYRLVSRFHTTQVGVVAGAAVVLATPIGFWASIPKRHIITATAAVVALYCFAVSREGTERRHLVARGLSYAMLGLLTTVHPFEAFFLFVVLAVVDVVTAPSNSPRTLGLIGAGFVLSLLPFLVINTLISGNPIKSPRLLSGYAGQLDIPDPTAEDPGGAGGAGTSGQTGGAGGSGGSGAGGGSAEERSPGLLDGIVDPVLGSVGAVVEFAWSLAEFALAWVEQSLAVLSEPEKLYHTFVRSGQIPKIDLRANDFEAVELTLLESFPLVAAFVWLPVSVVQQAQAMVTGAGGGTPARQTDLLAAGFAVVFTLVYLPRLPLHSQVTLRYILPVMPLLLYGVIRLSAVHETLAAVPRWVVGGYLTVVGVGGAGLVGVLAVIDPAIGEAMQLHALVGLAAAALAVVAVVTCHSTRTGASSRWVSPFRPGRRPSFCC